jgi:hypothetical protein
MAMMGWKIIPWPTDPARAWLEIGCEKKCKVPLREGPHVQGKHAWGWNGKVTGEVTVTPSVNCTECGFHSTLVNGTW